ncbi:uncharacterized protein CBL_02908 [Carabus blaptoides fortunei]
MLSPLPETPSARRTATVDEEAGDILQLGARVEDEMDLLVQAAQDLHTVTEDQEVQNPVLTLANYARGSQNPQSSSSTIGWFEECDSSDQDDEDFAANADDSDEAHFTEVQSEYDSENESYAESASSTTNTKNATTTTTKCYASRPTRYAKRNVDTVCSSFRLFFRDNILNHVVQGTNAEVHLKHGDLWKNLDAEEFLRFVGLLILAGVYKSHNEGITNLWNVEGRRPTFNKIMSRNRFSTISQCLRFDNAEVRRRNR